MRFAPPTLLLAAAALALFPVAWTHAADGDATSSFVVKGYEFDRGNVTVYDHGTAWADGEAILLNAGPLPNTAEYDLDFPVTADYAIWANYASASSRPVDLFLDGAPLVLGLKGDTGSFNSSTAKWEQQTTTHIEGGKHTFKFVCPGPCIPHVVAFRFDSSKPFPAGWKRVSPPMREILPPWSGHPEAGKTGFDAYVHPDGFVDAPADYDPTIPYAPIPAPNPRGERILEYLLMGEGRYAVTAQLEPGAAGEPWQAKVSVQAEPGRIEAEALTLDAERVRHMLAHSQMLLGRFGPMSRGADRAELRQTAERIARELDRVIAHKANDRGKAEALYTLYVKAFRLKSRIALSNPLLDFNRLVFARRFTYDTSHIYTTYFDGSHRFGGNLGVLGPVRPDGQVREIPTGLAAPAIFRDPDLSWDASRLLFSYKPDAATPCRIYEVGLDGSGLRKLTDTEYDDVDPCYLPDGRIMFVSTRCRRVVLCSNVFTTSVLYRMRGDGSDVECLSANTVNEFTPSVMPDGRVAYTRWEYVDKHLGNNQSLWVVNPDGSNAQDVAGEHWGPITFWEPRAIPGSSKLICTLAPHMPIAAGPIALIDPADVCSSPARFENVTPEIPPPHHFGWHRPRMGYYCNPYPLSEDFYIVSYNYGPEDRDPKGYGLYLLDRWGNRDLIYRDPAISCFEAIPVKARPRPPVVPDTATGTGDTGTFCLLDVYKGLPGVARGSVKYLRVVREIPKPVSAECSDRWLQYPLISYGGHLALKCLLGEVPVAPDGSAFFRVPANQGVYFSALDENHMEVQRMRAMTQVRPGETLSCVGCHDQRTGAPPTRRGGAFLRPVADITPPAGGPRAPDFYRDVQPILNRNCAKCHTGQKPAGGLNLSAGLTNRFNIAYESLMTGGLVSYIIANNSDTLPLRPPMYYGSHASRLIKTLQTSHADRVKLPPTDLAELATWIDLNAPYYSTYRYSHPNTEGARELLSARTRGALQLVFSQSCASCHKQETGRVERINFEDVRQSPALLAPLAVKAGGTGACGGVFGSRADPGAKALTAALDLIAEELRANPREDVQAQRPPMLDENCRYVFRP